MILNQKMDGWYFRWADEREQPATVGCRTKLSARKEGREEHTNDLVSLENRSSLAMRHSSAFLGRFMGCHNRILVLHLYLFEHQKPIESWIRFDGQCRVSAVSLAGSVNGTAPKEHSNLLLLLPGPVRYSLDLDFPSRPGAPATTKARGEHCMIGTNFLELLDFTFLTGAAGEPTLSQFFLVILAKFGRIILLEI